jgi:hypothetical protein
MVSESAGSELQRCKLVNWALGELIVVMVFLVRAMKHGQGRFGARAWLELAEAMEVVKL